MSSGLLAKATPASNTETLLYRCPSNHRAMVNLTMLNTNVGISDVSIARIDYPKSPLVAADYNWYNFDLTGNGANPVEWIGVALSSGQCLVVKSSLANVNFFVTGIEELVPLTFDSKDDIIFNALQASRIGSSIDGSITGGNSFVDTCLVDNVNEFVKTGSGGQIYDLINKEMVLTASTSGTTLVRTKNYTPTDVTIEAVLQALGNCGYGFVWRYQNVNNYYKVVFTTSAHSTDPNEYFVFKVVGGTTTQIANGSASFIVGTPHKAKIEVVGTSIKLYWDGVLLNSSTDSAITSHGYVGYWSEQSTGSGECKYKKASFTSGSNITTGSAITSFVRNTTAYNSDGTTVTANTPRFKAVASKTGILLESAMTNLLTNTDFATDLSSWTVVGSVTRDTAEAWTGPASARLFSATSANDTSIEQAFSAVASKTYTVSAWIKRVQGSTVRLVLQPRDGSNAPLGSPVTITPAPTLNTWTRIDTIVTTPVLTTNVLVTFTDTTGGGNTEYFIDAVQAEVEKTTGDIYLTSYHSGTRDADILKFPGHYINRSAGTIIVEAYVSNQISAEYTNPDADTTYTLFSCTSQYVNGDTYPAQRIAMYYIATDNVLHVDLANGTTLTALDPVTTVTNGWHRFGLKWNSSELSVWKDGIKLTQVAMTTNLLPQYIGLDAVLGQFSSTSPNTAWNEPINLFEVYTESLSDTEMGSATVVGTNNPLRESQALKLYFGDGIINASNVSVYTTKFIDTKNARNLFIELDKIETITTGSSILYYFRTSSNSNGLGATTWQTSLVGLNQRYIQIKVLIVATDINTLGNSSISHLHVVNN